MPPWFLPASLAAICIGIHYTFLRAASGRLGDTIGALVLEATAALGIAIAYVVLPRSAVETTRAGLVYSALSGLGITGASILLFTALRRGGPVATTGTIVLGGGVVISAVLAPWLFHEGMNVRRGIGIALGIAAMVVLSQDE